MRGDDIYVGCIGCMQLTSREKLWLRTLYKSNPRIMHISLQSHRCHRLHSSLNCIIHLTRMSARETLLSSVAVETLRYISVYFCF
jgi:hypothetical protein